MFCINPILRHGAELLRVSYKTNYLYKSLIVSPCNHGDADNYTFVKKTKKTSHAFTIMNDK